MTKTRTLTAAAPFTRLLDDIAGAIERAEFLDKVAASRRST